MIRDRRVIVVYDITDDKRRRRLATALKGFGIRTQFSFFECFLSETQLERLRVIIRKIVDPDEDRVGIMDICGICFDRIERIGYDEPEIFEETDIIV